MDFRDKHIVITGAANGLGKALVKKLFTEGAILYLGDIDEEGLNELKKEFPQRVFTYLVDVSSRASVEAWKRAIEKETEHIDILINNAGVTVLASFADHRPEDWERVMGVNVRIGQGLRQETQQLQAEQHQQTCKRDTAEAQAHLGQAGRIAIDDAVAETG